MVPWTIGILLLAVSLLTFVVASIKPIQGYLIILVFVLFLGFGGGW